MQEEGAGLFRTILKVRAAQLITRPSSSRCICPVTPWTSKKNPNMWFLHSREARGGDSFTSHIYFPKFCEERSRKWGHQVGHWCQSSSVEAQSHQRDVCGTGFLCGLLVLDHGLTVSLIVGVNTAYLISGCWLTAPACKISQVWLWELFSPPSTIVTHFWCGNKEASLDDWRMFMKSGIRLTGWLTNNILLVKH